MLQSPISGYQFAKISLSNEMDKYAYNAIVSPSLGTYVAVGKASSKGTVIRSTDFGFSWTSAYNSSDILNAVAYRLLNGVDYFIATTAKQNVLVSTVSSATTWTKYLTTTSNFINSVTIGSNGNAFIAGANNFVRRSDYTSSFATWTSISSTLPGISWNGISSYDGTNVIIVGNSGTIYYTSTSGSSWSAGSSGTSSVVIYSVAHVSSSEAYAGGASGYLSKTTNGGSTWTSVSPFSTSYTIYYNTIHIVNSSVVYVAGNIGSTSAAVYLTSNSGSSWTLFTTANTAIFSLSGVEATTGVAGAGADVGILGLVSGTLSLIDK